jgi:hypothetical protein
MVSSSKNRILDHNSEEFKVAFDEAFEVAQKRRHNPNKSIEASYNGYCDVVNQVGKELGEATKKALKEFGWTT